MPKRISFYEGCALDGNRFATLASFDALEKEPEEPSDRFSFDVFDTKAGSWRRITAAGGHGRGVSRYQPNPAAPSIAAALTRGGKVFLDQSPLVEDQTLPMDTDALVGLHAVGRNLYVLGRAGHFFYRAIDGAWHVLDPAFFQPNFITTPEELYALAGVSTYEEFEALPIPTRSAARIAANRDKKPFYAINGLAHNDLYLAGADGGLLHFDGQKITRLDSGVKTGFTDIRVDEAGEVYLAGARGGSAVLKGNRASGFTPIFKAKERDLYVYNIALFAGELYIADVSDTTGGLYRLRGDRAEPVSLPGQKAPTRVWKVDAADGVLWVLETKRLHRFDGTVWQTFTHPQAL